MKSRREKEKNSHIHTETISRNAGTHKEGEYGHVLFIVVPYPIGTVYLSRTHAKATATETASTDREEEGVVVLLSFVPERQY